ncbi:MAG: 2-succinyl-6-hydroxy-2,4-cyclohexadiene-1-carboxylate synthase [Dehalococcoidia bacterium]|nr:2-succinyl-6-hydroxy-2,4-cyclohexadiene-1-carboxylate synthase [Dehalococcoidia bacterium]MCB9486975.1 2-succinyl-6-hydroxy-2,4-cyclohexadiene-1-carboxylate synthase [Thermoflexaceae bacterium]
MTRLEIRPGFSLNVEVRGAGTPLVLLHGFTGSAAGWGRFGERLAERHALVALDIVGHGLSDKPETVADYRMERAAADIVAVVRHLGYERATWLGYSMGGRTALQVAVAHPEAVECLVLIGGAPGISSASERAARVASDQQLADRIERDGIEAFVEYWENIPLFTSQHRMPAERQAAVRAGRLACDPTGLANSLRGMGAGAQRPLHGDLAGIRAPVLAIAGELDTKYAGIGREISESVPGALTAVIADAGHAPQVERPDDTAAMVLEFLAQNPLAVAE